MIARYSKIARRLIAAARTTPRALAYWTLAPAISAAVAAGRLIRTGDFLTRIGGNDLKDGQKSWFGRHVAKAHRAATGTDAPRCWVQHRTTGKWIKVFVYGPIAEALYTGLRSYKGTRHLLTVTTTEAA